ncbi:hypothetical protein HG537_0B06810 [Torulaspora globosa]|uniref:Mediator of RNA polymerase II transcription subunit 14 n=1 Tax=Torulaspora globosa TaxID=48254 RepID=A0A7H9HPW3_9SACH|nr:hypothetical protein HG537_0B06810 [Torulaspora sp. CBS 2947]
MTTEMDSAVGLPNGNGVSGVCEDSAVRKSAGSSKRGYGSEIGNKVQDSSDRNVLQTPDSGARKESKSATPPPIPHVEINQVSLAMLIRNLTVFTVKEISQFMKTNVHVNPQEPSSMKKFRFLQLIIFVRNQFLKLYVLVKWCRTIKNNNFHTIIDLLNWFRITNVTVNNCIWALKNNVTAMANAKLPNADLATALEVLSLGRTNLPTHNFKVGSDGDAETAPGGMLKIPSKLVLRRLKDLNTAVCLKMALVELPAQFENYSIKNGRVYITVTDEFEIQLATIDCHSPLFFVDLRFLFTDRNLALNKLRIEKVINEILFKSSKPMVSLYNFLHKYVLTLQLYMIHSELSDLENGGKFSGGNLVHRYDSKRSIITVKYWLHSKMGEKAKIIIGVEKSSESLVLKWDNRLAADSRMPVVYHNIMKDLESILDEIMFNHSYLIRADLLAKGVFQEDEENSDILLFQMPATCLSVAPIQLKVDTVSGVFYFRNPTPLLLRYVNQINRAENAEELTAVLQKLKLEKITHILRNMFEKTGWTCSRVVKLDRPIESQTTHMDSNDSLLQDDLFICLPNWLANWYLILTVISSNTSCVVEKRIGKVISNKGKWQLTYLGKSSVTTAKLETITYQKLLHLQKTIFHKIVNHMIIDSLNQLKIRNKVCASEFMSASLPAYISEGNTTGEGDLCISIIALELESFLEGSKALNSILESSMFMKIDYSRSEVKLFGKFKRDTKMIKCECDELLIHFVPQDSLAFYLCESFTNLNLIAQYLTKFRQKLMQLVVLTDVVERLHKNFASEDFKIVALKPNEISFKYLKNSDDTQDCTISIITNDQTVENLTVQLSPSNPQHIIQPFIDRGHLDYHFIFDYLQFTSSLFNVLKNILMENQNRGDSYTTVDLGLHNLCECQLLYHNPEVGTKITLIIELKNVSHNGRSKSQFYIHFSEDEHISTKSLAYPLVHRVRNQVFMLESKDNNSAKIARKCPNAVKLVEGISCDSADVEPILLEIHSILRTDSNIAVETTDSIPSAASTTIPAT